MIIGFLVLFYGLFLGYFQLLFGGISSLCTCVIANLQLFLLSVIQGPNSILVILVMLINIGLAIIFVHFLT